MVAGFLLLCALGLLVLVHANLQSRDYRIVPYAIFTRKKLPKPLKILHLSDTHFSRKVAKLSLFFNRLSTEVYDLIVITGDIFDSTPGAAIGIENLKKLRSRHGIYAVFGNHDYYDYRLLDVFGRHSVSQSKPKNKQPVALFEKALKEAGVRLLRNETIEISIDGVSLLLHGLDDPTTGRANLRETMERFDPKKLNLLLTHTVDVFLDIGENDIDVSFSGHSHGGQIRLPWIGPLITHTMFGKHYTDGVCSLQGASCVISKGVGTSRFMPFRLLCPPEAIVVGIQSR